MFFQKINGHDLRILDIQYLSFQVFLCKYNNFVSIKMIDVISAYIFKHCLTINAEVYIQTNRKVINLSQKIILCFATRIDYIRFVKWIT